jgi:hypothetical protein
MQIITVVFKQETMGPEINATTLFLVFSSPDLFVAYAEVLVLMALS